MADIARAAPALSLPPRCFMRTVGVIRLYCFRFLDTQPDDYCKDSRWDENGKGERDADEHPCGDESSNEDKAEAFIPIAEEAVGPDADDAEHFAYADHMHEPEG